MNGPLCDYCGKPSRLTNGAEVYGPRRRDLANVPLWACMPCGAWVGCHPPARKDGTGGQGRGITPLGRLANAELRAAKSAAHRAFDPLWKSGAMTRTKAYAWLAEQLGLTLDECHIGMFDVEQCERVTALAHKHRPQLCPVSSFF